MNAPIPAHWKNFQKRDKLAVTDTRAAILRDPIGEVARNAKHREPVFKPCRNAQVVEAVFEIPGREVQGVVFVGFDGSKSSRCWEMGGGRRAEKGINSPGVKNKPNLAIFFLYEKTPRRLSPPTCQDNIPA